MLEAQAEWVAGEFPPAPEHLDLPGSTRRTPVDRSISATFAAKLPAVDRMRVRLRADGLKASGEESL
jgi:hypothetical protein